MAACILWLTRTPWLAGSGLSALTLAIAIGMGLGNALPAARLQPLAWGMGFARQYLLRWGVALYGTRLTLDAVLALGLAGVVVPLTMLVSTLLLGTWLGCKVLRLPWRDALVISVGSAVCGAAAALAAASVLRAPERQTAVAVATVVVFGTLGMLLYPLLYALAVHRWAWAVDPRMFGIFTGATLHEVAQVMAAGDLMNPAVAHAAVVSKMVRVLALAPVLLVLGCCSPYGDGSLPKKGVEDAAQGAAASANSWLQTVWRAIPWFALGLVLVMAVNTWGWLPASAQPALFVLDDWLLACAMLAIGLQTRMSDLRRSGGRAMALAGLLFVFLIAAGSALSWWMA